MAHLPEQKAKEDSEKLEAYDAGYDYGINGANTINCRFTYFATEKSRTDWEKGNRDAKRVIEISKGTIPKKFLVHILVAKYFIPNPDNKPQVNHKNGIKTDNRMENLEWSTCKENINHAFDTGLNIKIQKNDTRFSKPVIQMSLSGFQIAEYPSLIQVERSTGFRYPNIHHAIKNKIISNGYLWKYKN